MRETMQIEGMHCAHCVESVAQALAALDGVEDVRVDLASGRATFRANPENPPERSELERAVEEAGYRIA